MAGPSMSPMAVRTACRSSKPAATRSLGRSPANGSLNVVAVTPDARQLYVGHYTEAGLSVIDTSGNGVASIPLNTVDGMSVAPDGRYAYATNGSSNTVFAIDTSSNKVAGTIPGKLAQWGGGRSERPAPLRHQLL